MGESMTHNEEKNMKRMLAFIMFLMCLAAVVMMMRVVFVNRKRIIQAQRQRRTSIIDDRLSYLVDSGQIIRVQRGVFIPAPKHRPSRIMCKMVLPDGTVKIEIGDDEVLTLTPREARNLGNLMVAEAMQYANIEMGHHMAILQSEISGQVRKLTRQVGD